MILLIISYLLLLYVEIFGEVIFGDKHDLKSNVRLFSTLSLAFFMGMLSSCSYGIFIYLFIRLLLFDISFGYLFKGDIWYLGTTSKWDIYKRKLIDYIKKHVMKINPYFFAPPIILILGYIFFSYIPDSFGVPIMIILIIGWIFSLVKYLIDRRKNGRNNG